MLWETGYDKDSEGRSEKTEKVIRRVSRKMPEMPVGCANECRVKQLKAR